MAFYQASAGTLKVPMSLYATNRQTLIKALQKLEGSPENGFVFLMGGKQELRNDTDHELLFRQVRDPSTSCQLITFSAI